MINIQQLSLSVHHNEEDLVRKISKSVRQKHFSYQIRRKSIDARNKENIRYIYNIDVFTGGEQYRPSYRLPENGKEILAGRPVIVGFGPAGIFCALMLARKGMRPLVLEKGKPADRREMTEVCFGEGGAGTFSDGKLNTLVKDDSGRNEEVLRTFVAHGADEEILFEQKPHIGTDRLIGIITSIRKEIIRLGGEVRFETEMTDFAVEDGRLVSLTLSTGEVIPASAAVLASGHSARDTFALLKARNLRLEAKPFAVGLRIQHPQKMIDVAQFGEKEADFLSPASYKLTGRAGNGRGVYTFCMCPGGYVIESSTEKEMLCINGMSYHARNSQTANSALIVTVTPADFPSEDPLSGIEFQRALEKAAYRSGEGKIPVQLLGDYIKGFPTSDFGEVAPRFQGETSFARLDRELPGFLRESILDVMPSFDSRIAGFGRYDAILAGIESRTSSPVRVVRNEEFVSDIEGLYPCGEGAGYAGGIMSAAMDGMKVAEAIIRKYRQG